MATTLVPAWMVFLGAGLAPHAAAQIPAARGQVALSLGVSIGTSVFSGAARGAGDRGEQLLFIPYRPTMFGVTIGYGGEPFRLEATASLGEPGLAVRGAGVPQQAGSEGVLIVIENAFRVRTLSLGASIPLWHLRGGPVLRAAGAVLVERWTSPDTPARTVAGGQAGLSMEVVLTGSLSARAEGVAGFTPASPFRQADLPPGFRPTGTWRKSLGVGVSWKL